MTLPDQLPTIAKALERGAREIQSLVEEAARLGKIADEKWAKEKIEWDRREAEKRRVESVKRSREELLLIFEAWQFEKTVERFFIDAEARLAAMPPEERDPLQARLALARSLVGELDAMRLLVRWHTPEEWVNASNLYTPLIRDERRR